MCDCRVISYGWARGRVRVNNRAYERLGMVAVATSRPQLAHALVAALSAPPARTRRSPSCPPPPTSCSALAEREPAHAG